MVACVLIADDDPMQRQQAEAMVRRCGFEAVTAGSGDEAIAILAEQPIDALLLDLVMPGLDGMGVLARMRTLDLSIPVVMMVSQGGIDNVSSVMRAGAHDFVVTPLDFPRLQVSLRNALDAGALRDEISRTNHRHDDRLSFSDIIARSAAMEPVMVAARKAAASATIPVLIEGEVGTGKEFMARTIHGSGELHGKPFITVDCKVFANTRAGLTIDQTLFAPAGAFAQAAGGTLFLDEVTALPPATQARLLQVLQDGAIRVAGERKPLKIHARLIATASLNLFEQVKAGLFREDLFYRLHALPFTLPPLRARRDDIPHLLRGFLARICARENRTINGISSDAMTMLMRHDWPGNLRQLDRALHRAVILSDRDELGVGDFPADLAELDSSGGSTEPYVNAPALVTAPHLAPETGLPETEATGHQAMRNEPVPLGASSLSLLDAEGELRPLAELENEVIRFAIAHYRGQMSEVARRLKIGRSTLYRKLENDQAEAAPRETAPP